MRFPSDHLSSILSPLSMSGSWLSLVLSWPLSLSLMLLHATPYPAVTLMVRMTRVRVSTEWPCRIDLLTVSSCSDLV